MRKIFQLTVNGAYGANGVVAVKRVMEEIKQRNESKHLTKLMEEFALVNHQSQSHATLIVVRQVRSM